MSSLSLTDQEHDIDSYMAEQGDQDIPIILTPDGHPTTAPAPAFPSVPPAEKLAFVKRGKERKIEKGETWYLISRGWWKRWNKACTGEVDKEGPVTEQDLGPVNNSDIVDTYGNIRPSISESVDVEYVPEEVWLSFVTWYVCLFFLFHIAETSFVRYGEPIHPLPRQAVERGAYTKYISIELYPPCLKVFRLTDTPAPKTLPPYHKTLHISATDSITSLCKHLASLVSQFPDNHDLPPYRIWRLENLNDDQTALEISSHNFEADATGARIIEASSKTLEEEGIQTDDCFAVEFKKPGGWIVKEAPKVPITVLGRPGVPAPIFRSNEGFFNRMNTSTAQSSSTAVTSITSTNDSYDSLTPVGKWKKKEKSFEPGTVGLGNMCVGFLLSSLSSILYISFCQGKHLLHELCYTVPGAQSGTYGIFLEYGSYPTNTNILFDNLSIAGLYQEELNPGNPLGMHGAIAEAFGALLQRIWATSGPSSFSPREFKVQLQRFAPQFSGYQQHDSQELLAFLLDGLHEDLNRVLKKPYVEKPDWEGGGDLELMQFARKNWEGYMLRNDSVIVDLFQGQYQSTLICPECEKVS